MLDCSGDVVDVDVVVVVFGRWVVVVVLDEVDVVDVVDVELVVAVVTVAVASAAGLGPVPSSQKAMTRTRVSDCPPASVGGTCKRALRVEEVEPVSVGDLVRVPSSWTYQPASQLS